MAESNYGLDLSDVPQYIEDLYAKIDITDNYLFQRVMEHPEICREVVSRILGKPIASVNLYTSEKYIKVFRENKAVRLDAFVEDETKTVYDIEMQTVNNEDELFKRAMYYHIMMGKHMLKKGRPYKELNTPYVIFICTFDVLDYNYSKYSFKLYCEENKNIEYPEGFQIIFLNSKGRNKETSAELSNLLQYINGEKNTQDELIVEIEKKVHEVIREEDFHMLWLREKIDKDLAKVEERKDILNIMQAIKDGKSNSEIMATYNVTMEQIVPVRTAMGM